MSLPQEYTAQMTGLRGPGLTSEDQATFQAMVDETTENAARTAHLTYLGGDPFPGIAERDAYTAANPDVFALGDSTKIVGDGRYEVTAIGPVVWTRTGDTDGKVAADAADDAAASAALINASTQTTHDIVDTDADAYGSWWAQPRADGTTWIQKPCDAQGNRLDLQILSNAAAIAENTALLSRLIPSVPQLNLKRAAYDGVAPVTYASDPITVGAYTSSATLPLAVAKDDPRLRLLGGRWLVGTAFPATTYLSMQSITNGDPSVLAGTGLPSSRSGVNGGLDFVLPAGQTQVELHLYGTGGSYKLTVEIDGVYTNSAGYDLGPTSSGGEQYSLITFPAMGYDAHIRLRFGSHSFRGIRLPTGQTIKAYTPANPSSLAAMGDSIMQGAISTTIPKSWIMQFAARLGIDNVINLGVGGSGYLKRVGTSTARVTISTTSGSNQVTVTGTTSGAPAVGQFIKAAGFSNTAKVIGVSGSTLTISENCSATATGVPAYLANGYNFLDRVNDILMAVMPSTGAQATITLTAGQSTAQVTVGTVPDNAFIAGPDGTYLSVATKVTAGASAGGTISLNKPALRSGTIVIGVGLAPDGIVIAGGVNDFSVAPGGDYTTAETGAQALVLFQTLRAALPSVPIFVVGPWTDRNNPTYSATSQAGAAAIAAAAAQVPRTFFIDVSGVVTAANVGTVFGEGDGIHPVDAGHLIYGSETAADALPTIKGF